MIFSSTILLFQNESKALNTNDAVDTDWDGITDYDDEDDDNDGLKDNVEEVLGSNSTDPSDVTIINVSGKNYCLIDA